MNTSRKRRIVGLCGYPNSGKNEAANALVEDGWTQFAFADAVRATALGTDPYVKVDAGFKRLSTVVAMLGWEEAKRKHPDIRRLLQRLGTEGVRDNLGEDSWVNALDRKIAECGTDVVITDVRFPNEPGVITKHGGLLVWIYRNGTVPTNGHSSESHYSSFDIKFEIDNSGGKDGLHAAIRNLVEEEFNVPL